VYQENPTFQTHSLVNKKSNMADKTRKILRKQSILILLNMDFIEKFLIRKSFLVFLFSIDWFGSKFSFFHLVGDKDFPNK
jgi:hypothetical protein